MNKRTCAAKLETVVFHLGRRPDLTEFSPEDGPLIPCKGGYIPFLFQIRKILKLILCLD